MEAPQTTIFALLSLPSHSLHRWLLLQCLQITCDFLHLPTFEDPAKMNINNLPNEVMIEATVGLSEVDLTPRGTIESPPHNLNIKITSPIEKSNTPNVQAKNNSTVIVEIQSTATLVKMIITTEAIKGTTTREKIIKITEGPTTTTGRVGRKVGRGIIREKIKKEIEIRGKRRYLQTGTTSDNLRIEINMTTESKEIIEIHMADKIRQLKEAGREEGLEAEIEEEDEEEGDLLPKSLPKSRRKNPKNNQWRWNKVKRKLRVKNQEKNNQGRHHRQEILSQHKLNHRVSRLKNQKVRNSKFNPNKEAR
jgi:hypothetical protein